MLKLQAQDARELPACVRKNTNLAQIKIGAVTCLTGALSTFGVSSIQGAKLAVADTNAAGGLLGQPVELIVEDNGSRAGEAATITRKFIAQDKVVAILGDLTSSATMEAAPLAQAAKAISVRAQVLLRRLDRAGEWARGVFDRSWT